MCCPSCMPCSRASAGLCGFLLSEYMDICRLVCETRTAVCVCLFTVLSEHFLTGQLIMMAYLCMCNGMIYQQTHKQSNDTVLLPDCSSAFWSGIRYRGQITGRRPNRRQRPNFFYIFIYFSAIFFKHGALISRILHSHTLRFTSYIHEAHFLIKPERSNKEENRKCSNSSEVHLLL